MALYNIDGKEIALLETARKPAGENAFTLSSKEHKLAAGVYILRVTVGGESVTKYIVSLQ
jgi:hypothetical protein